MRLCALFRLAFAPASPHGLTSPHIVTRRLILQKARCHPYRLQRIVGTWFQELFHSPPGVLFTFPSRYLSAIGHQRIFRLTGWSRQIHTRFHGPRATREKTQTVPAVSSTGVAPSMPGPSRPFDYHQHFLLSPGLVDPRNVHPTTPNTQPLPGITRARFSLIRFRSPLLTESHVVFSSCGY